ncbi:hypothetical protein [Streptomyces sp. NPDC059850]|uniref:hypothetical protein n=1 Tax=Streptomyces sp. NPDC059850 TaxID=3346970 RepID=UPI003649DE2F
MNRSIRLAAVAVLGALVLTTCSTSYASGPAGRVVEKDRDTYKVGTTTITKR